MAAELLERGGAARVLGATRGDARRLGLLQPAGGAGDARQRRRAPGDHLTRRDAERGLSQLREQRVRAVAVSASGSAASTTADAPLDDVRYGRRRRLSSVSSAASRSSPRCPAPRVARGREALPAGSTTAMRSRLSSSNPCSCSRMRSLSGAVAGEDVAQEAAPQAPAHAQLVLAAQQVQRHQLLQEEQGRAGQLCRARPGGRGREHALGVVHDEHVAVEHPLAGVGDGQGVAGRSARRAVRLPQARRELGRAVRTPRARHHAPVCVEEHDGHVEDAGDALDELGDVLLLHHQLQQLDLQGGGAAQGLHVARRGRRLRVLAALPGALSPPRAPPCAGGPGPAA